MLFGKFWSCIVPWSPTKTSTVVQSLLPPAITMQEVFSKKMKMIFKIELVYERIKKTYILAKKSHLKLFPKAWIWQWSFSTFCILAWIGKFPYSWEVWIFSQAFLVAKYFGLTPFWNICICVFLTLAWIKLIFKVISIITCCYF